MRHASKGPWGDLELEKLPLENESELFVDGAERVKPTRWIFEKTSAQELIGLFQACNLNASEKQFLLDTNHWEVLPDGIVMSPPDAMALGLNRSARQVLFPILGTNPANYVQNWPYRFPPGGFEERFTDSGLAPERIEFLRSLTYTNGGYTCLCLDRPLLVSLGTNDAQLLIRALYSSPAWIVCLRVEPNSDINPVLNYWAKNGREKRLRPLLDSLARRPEGGTLNISYLLPPFARLRLYTYPDSEANPEEMRQDCFYTAMNFFNEKPDAQYLDNRNSERALQVDYRLVPAPAEFGDLVTVLDQNGKAIHVCVYIADDIVFTKNGRNYLQPWTLMRMADMMTFFPSETPLRIGIFRRKGTSSP
jgi:hypothetical protein